MKLGHALTKVSGRIFVRAVRQVTRPYGAPALNDLSRPMLLIGMIEVPRETRNEALHDVRLNSSFYLDVEHCHDARFPYGLPSPLGEMELGHYLTTAQHARGALPDNFEVFSRASFLKHADRDMLWVYVAGVLAEPMRALDGQGLFEFDAATDGFRKVSDNIFVGEPVSQIMRNPIWGPGGQWGTTTTMDPASFDAWLPRERAVQAARAEQPGWQGEEARQFMRFVAHQPAELRGLRVWNVEQRKAMEVASTQAIVAALAEEESLAAVAAPTP